MVRLKTGGVKAPRPGVPPCGHGLHRVRRARDAARRGRATSPTSSGTTTSASRRAPAVAPTSCGRRSPRPASCRCTSPRSTAAAAAGMSELAIVCEELAAQGCPLLLILVSAAICAELIAALRHRRAARRAGCPGLCSRREDGVRDHRARRRLEQPQPRDHRDARRRRLPAQRHQDLHLRRRRSAARCSWSRAPASTTPSRARRSSRSSSSTPTRPGSTARRSRSRSRTPRSSTRCSSTTSRCRPTGCSATRATACARCSYGLNPERIMSASICTGIGRYALDRAVGVRARARGVGRADRHAPGRRAPARATPRSSSSSRA